MRTFVKGDLVEVILSGDTPFLGIVVSERPHDFDENDQSLEVFFLETQPGTVISYGKIYSVSGSRCKLLRNYIDFLERHSL